MNITGNDKVHVSNILHKTKIKVNEDGTEAAAATGAVVIPLMGNMTPRVAADRPFAFIIYHVSSKNIVFEGVLSEPKEVMTRSLNGQRDIKFENPPGVQPLHNRFQYPYQLNYQRQIGY